MRTLEHNGVRLGVVNLTLELAAIEILRKHAETPRGHGRFVSRLLYEYEAKLEERRRLREQIHAVVDESGAPA
jgi:hypothetical protein